jgi:hypothetical protein
MAALTSEFSQLKAAAEIQAYEHALRAATDPFSPRRAARSVFSEPTTIPMHHQYLCYCVGP